VNLDPDPWFSEPKTEWKNQLKFFGQKMQFTYPKASIKNVKAQEKLSALKRDHPALEFYFLFLWIIFALLDSDPDPGTPLNPDQIRIRNTAF
jgi:hypothetical protein